MSPPVFAHATNEHDYVSVIARRPQVDRGALNAAAPNDKAAMRFTSTAGFEGMPDVMPATCGGFEGIEHAHARNKHENVRVMRIERSQPGNEKESSR